MPSFLRVSCWHCPFFSTPMSVSRSLSTWLLFPPCSRRHILPSVSTSLGAFFIRERLPSGVLAFLRIMFTVELGSTSAGSLMVESIVGESGATGARVRQARGAKCAPAPAAAEPNFPVGGGRRKSHRRSRRLKRGRHESTLPKGEIRVFSFEPQRLTYSFERSPRPLTAPGLAAAASPAAAPP